MSPKCDTEKSYSWKTKHGAISSTPLHMIFPVPADTLLTSLWTYMTFSIVIVGNQNRGTIILSQALPELFTLSLRESPVTLCKKLISTTYICSSDKAHDHSWGEGRRSTGILGASILRSALSAFSPQFCETSLKSGFWETDTLSNFKIRLKPFFLIKHRVGSGDHESFLSNW